MVSVLIHREYPSFSNSSTFCHHRYVYSRNMQNVCGLGEVPSFPPYCRSSIPGYSIPCTNCRCVLCQAEMVQLFKLHLTKRWPLYQLSIQMKRCVFWPHLALWPRDEMWRMGLVWLGCTLHYWNWLGELNKKSDGIQRPEENQTTLKTTIT